MSTVRRAAGGPVITASGALVTAAADAPGEDSSQVANDSTGVAGEPREEENKSTVMNRVLGGLQAVWGGGQAIGGAAFAIGSAETVVGTVAGAAVAAHGVDDFVAGFQQMRTGKPVENATQMLATEAAKKAGASPQTAAVIGAAVDAVAGGPNGGLKKAGEKVAQEVAKRGRFAKEMTESVFQDGKTQERELNELERGATVPEGTHKIQDTANPRTSASNKPSAILAKKLERAGDPPPGPNHEAHHIVPFDDPRVAPLRTSLEKLGVDLNSAANGVWLPRGGQADNVQGAARHEFTFSDEYIAALKDALKGASSREDALARLQPAWERPEERRLADDRLVVWPRNRAVTLRQRHAYVPGKASSSPMPDRATVRPAGIPSFRAPPLPFFVTTCGSC